MVAAAMLASRGWGTDMTEAELERHAIDVVRGLAMDAPHAARSGHQGTAMALAPLAHVLWTRIMTYDASDPSWPDRDRFILSAGHASILLYSMLHLTGHGLTLDDLRDEIRTNVRTLAQNRQTYIINQKALIVAEREREKARLDMLAGERVSPRDILEAQTAVAKAQNDVTKSLINFHTQRLKLLYNTGILNTGLDQFWIKPQPVPGVAPVVPLPPGAEQDVPVLPPAQILGN
jgi:hypothetical protein